MESDPVCLDAHPIPVAKKVKADGTAVKETTESLCNGRNGMELDSPNTPDSCDSPSDHKSVSPGTKNGVKTNGVNEYGLDDTHDRVNHKQSDLNSVDTVVLCDDERKHSDEELKGANSPSTKPAKDTGENGEQTCDKTPDIVVESAKGNVSGDSLTCNDNMSDSKQQVSTPVEGNNHVKTGDSAKEESDKVTQVLSPRRSTRLSGSSDDPPKDENKENLENAKVAVEPAKATPTPDSSTQSQDSAQKGSRIARLMENREAGELENMRPMAGLLFSVGLDLARQQIFKDLIRVQSKKQSQKKLSTPEEDQLKKLKEAFDVVVSKNDAYVQDTVACTQCSFKTEARNVLEWHREFAHDQDSGMYTCSFCDYQDRSPGNFFFHMEAEHNRRGRIYMRSPFYSCPLCPFENNSKASMNKHKMKCERHFKLKRNLEPTPTDCDIPLKKVKKPVPKQPVKKPLPVQQPQHLPRVTQQNMPTIQPQRPLPPMPPLHRPPSLQRAPVAHNAMQGMSMATVSSASVLRPGMVPPMLQPQPGIQQYSIGGGMYTLINNNGQIIMQPAGMPAIPLGQSSMINANALAQTLAMPLNRLQVPQQNLSSQSLIMANANKPKAAPRPGTVASEIARKKVSPPPATPQTPPQFEICEICGGFVKDRESLRIHFYWAHKVDIHKEIFDQARAHLPCESCPQRFWTYQGLARHRLTKHSKNSNQKRYHCQICGRSNVDNLLQHLQSSHGIGLNALFVQKKCLCCGMMFAQRSSLERHLMHTHSDLFKNYSGMQSKQVAKTPSPVKHTTPSVISPASKSKASPVPIGLFENAVGKKKMYEPFCSICNISFPSMEAFKLHCSRLHSFKCYRCGQNYSSEEMRFKHFQDTHKNEKEACQICGDKIIIGRPMVRHMKRCHIKDCSVVVQRMSEQKFKHFMKKRQEKLAKEKDEAVKKMQLSNTQKPIGSKLAIEEVIIIDEDEEKETLASKNTSTTRNRSPVKGTTASTTPVETSSSAKPIPSPTPGLKEQVMEVDGEQFIIQMQEDEDDSVEDQSAQDSGQTSGEPEEEEVEDSTNDDDEQGQSRVGENKNKSSVGEVEVCESKKNRNRGKTEGEKDGSKHNDNVEAAKPIKDSSEADKCEKQDDKDPTADAVELLQNIADEIATNTKPMETD